MQPDYKLLPEEEQSRVDEKVRKETKKRTKHITDNILRMSSSDIFTEIEQGARTKEEEQRYVKSVNDTSDKFVEHVSRVTMFLEELSNEQAPTNPFGEDKLSQGQNDKIQLLNDLTDKYLAPIQSKIAEVTSNQNKENEKKQKADLYFNYFKQHVETYGEPPPEGLDITDSDVELYNAMSESGQDFIVRDGKTVTLDDLQKKIDGALVNYLKDIRDVDEKKSYWDNNVQWFSPIWESDNNKEFVKGLSLDIGKGILGVYGISETIWEHAQKQNETLQRLSDHVKKPLEENNFYSGIFKDALKDDATVQAIKDLNLLSQPQFRERPFVIEALKSTVTSLAALPMYMYGLGELKLMQPIAEIGWKVFAKNLLKSPFYTQLPTLTGQVIDQVKQGHVRDYGDFISLIGKTYVQGLAEVIGEVSTGFVAPYLPKGLFKKVLSSRFGKELDFIANKLNIDIEKSAQFLVTQPFAETMEEELSNLITGDPSIYTGDFNLRRLSIEAVSSLGMGLPLSVWYGKIKNDDINRSLKIAERLGIENIELDRSKIVKYSDEEYSNWIKDLNKGIQEVDKSQIIQQFGEELYNLIGSKAQETFNANKEEIHSKIAEVVDNHIKSPSETLESITKPFVDGSLESNPTDIVSIESLQNKTYGQVAVQTGINLEEPTTIQDVFQKVTNAVIGHSLDNEVVNEILTKVGNFKVEFAPGENSSWNGLIKKDGTIIINSNAVNEGTNNVLYTVLHEGIHAVIGDRLNTDPKFKARVEALIANVYHTDPEIAEFIDGNLIANYPQDKVAEEFLTNLFSRKSVLVGRLKDMPAAKRQTFIGKIIDFIKEALGLQNNTYDELKKIVFGGKVPELSSSIKYEINSKEDRILNLGKKTITLNDQQYEGVLKVRDFLNSEKTAFTLSGYAGTGKTTIIKKILDENADKDIVVTAPTHKAKNVIAKSTGFSSETIQSVLGLSPNIDLEKFNPRDPIFSKKKPSKMPGNGILVVDEASMLNEELLGKILEEAKSNHSKVIFMGDQAQIPPINEKLSLVFKNPNNHQLTKVERTTEGNPLFKVFDEIRDNLEQEKFSNVTNFNEATGEGIYYIKEPSLFRELVAKWFIPNYRVSKIIAWSNNRVAAINSVVREMLWGTEKAKNVLNIGESLMLYKRLKAGFENLSNSDEVTVTYIDPEVKTDYDGIQYLDIEVAYTDDEQTSYYLELSDEERTKTGLHMQGALKVKFALPSTENFNKYTKVADNLINQAKKNRTLWPAYYEFVESYMIMSPSVQTKTVDYGYAITGHKSQGSTYKFVFVDESNIDLNQDVKERNRIKYTAISRATHGVFVLTGHTNGQGVVHNTPKSDPEPEIPIVNAKEELLKTTELLNDEAKITETHLLDPLPETVDESELSGMEEGKIVEALPEVRLSQSIGSTVKQLINLEGRQVFANNKELRDVVFNLDQSLTTQQKYDEFIKILGQRGVDFNNSLIVKMNRDYVRETGLTYFHHAFHSIITSTEQTVAVINAKGEVTLIGKGTPVSSYKTEDGTYKSTVGRKKMKEVIQEQLKEEGGLDIQIYEVAGFENIVPKAVLSDGTFRPERKNIKNSFSDFRPHAFTDTKLVTPEDKMNLYRRRLVQQGFVVIPTEKTHLLLDIRKFKMKDQQGEWVDYGLDMSKLKFWKQGVKPLKGKDTRPPAIWEGIFSTNDPIKNRKLNLLIKEAREFNETFNDEEKTWAKQYYNRDSLYGYGANARPEDRAISDRLSNMLFDSVHAYMFHQFARRVLPEAPSDKDVFKRLNNLGGNASRAIMFDDFKANLPTSKDGNYMWLDGENVMFRSAVLDSSTLGEAMKLFGKDFKPGDGVAFILPQKRAMFNKVNLESKTQSIALKYKTFEIGTLLKKSDQVVHPDTHPELWKFMIANGIAEINMDTAVKVGSKIKKQGVKPLSWEQIRNKHVVSTEHTFDRNMMNDSIMFSKDEVKDVARGVLPTYVRGALLYLLKGKARTRAYNHFLGGFDKLQKELNQLKDPVDRLNALKRMAQNNRETGFSTSTLRFIENLNSENANLMSLDIFADLFFDGVVKKMLQDSLNHAQYGSSLTLMPDIGNYQRYLVNSGQITKEQAAEYFEDGFLKDGYMIMDAANYKNLQVKKSGNKVMLFVNPPSGYQDGRAMEVIGVLPDDMGVNGIVTPNGQLQVISGKDYDIDIAIPIPCNTDLLQEMWQDLKDLALDEQYKQDIKQFTNPTMALRLTLELYPEVQQFVKESGITSYDALKDETIMKGKVAIEPEDAYLAYDETGQEFLGINPSFSAMSFKNPKSLNDFLAKLDQADISRLYNMAVFYTEFLQYENKEAQYSVEDDKGNTIGAVKISIDPSRISFNLTALNRLTHLVLDWLNNLKLFTFNYNPDVILERLFKVERVVQTGSMAEMTDAALFKLTAEKSIMSARKLLKFKEVGRQATFKGLWDAIKEASETYKENTLIGQSAVRADKLDISGFKISNEEQAQVYEYVRDVITQSNPESWTSFAETSAEILNTLTELAKRETQEPYTHFDRLSRLKDRSEKLGIDVYGEFLMQMFRTHSFGVPDSERTSLQFKVNEDKDTGRVYIFNQGKSADGQLTGKINYQIKVMIDGKFMENQTQNFESFDLMLKGQSGIAYRQELLSIFHRNNFPAYIFHTPNAGFIDIKNDTFRNFLRDYISKTYNSLTENEQFRNSPEEVQKTFYHATLSYHGKKYSLENVQMLKEYKENSSEKVRTVSYADALILMSENSNPIAQQIFQTWLSTANEKIKQFVTPTENDKLSVKEFDPLLRVEGEDLQEFYGLISDKEAIDFYMDSHNATSVVKLISGDIVPYNEYEQWTEEERDKNWIIKQGTRVSSNGETRFIGIPIYSEDNPTAPPTLLTEKDLVSEAKDFWIDQLFSSYHNLNQSLGNKNKDVKKQVRKLMAKALRASQGQARDRYLEFFARNLPFARTILFFSNRNKVYPPQANVVTYYINGKKLTAKATEIATLFDLKYAEGSPIRLSGAMIDWYVRLQSHYEASNTQNLLRGLTDKVIETLNSSRGELVDVNDVAQSTTVQMAAWDIAEGKTKILKPGDFTFQPNGKFHQMVFNGQEYAVAYDSITNTNVDEFIRMATDMIKAKNIKFDAVNENEKRFKSDLLVRSLAASLQYRYIYDYVTPALISSQINNMNAIMSQSMSYDPDSSFRSMTISITDQYINRLVNMMRQIEGINDRLNANGQFYMPRTFEDRTFNFKAMEKKLTEIYLKKGFTQGQAESRAKKEVKLAQDETRHEVNGSNPLHSSYLKRLYDDESGGYLKDYKVTSDYLDQLSIMFRFQNLTAYEAFNGRFTAQENPFMLHELRFMSAVARNSDYYYEPIKKLQSLSKGQFVQFQALKGEFWTLMSGEVAKANKENISVFRPDGTVETYDRLSIKNLSLMKGVALNKKFTLFARKIVGVEPEWINRTVTFLSRNKLKASNLAMLGTKPWYAARNVAGAMFNVRGYFGNEDYNAGETMQQVFNEWKKNHDKPLSDIQADVFEILVNHASAIMGDVDTVMGRFGGLVTLMEDQLTPETVRLHNERSKEWTSAKEEFISLEAQMKANPEDVGLKHRFFTRIPELMREKFDKWGMQNIPFGWPIGTFLPKVRENMYFNAMEGEKVWRDRTVLTMAQVLASHFNLYQLKGEDSETAKNVIRRFVISNISHAVNSTQFQYIPGFFLSHFDSTVNGKAWFKQFSHYSNSLEWTYIGRIENGIRQMQQFGIAKIWESAGFEKPGWKNLITWYLPLSKAKKLKYDAIVGDPDKLVNMTFEEYVELSRAIRMTAFAVFTALVKRVSIASRRLIRTAIGADMMFSIFDMVFNNMLSESASIPTVQAMINWATHFINSPFGLPDDDDEKWEKNLKKATEELFGKSPKEYIEKIQRQTREQMGSDYVSGFYGEDPAKYFENESLTDEIILDDYYSQVFRDLFIEGVPLGVGENQMITFAFDAMRTGILPNNMRQTMFNFAQTQLPFGNTIAKVLRSTKFTKGYVPGYDRVGELRRRIQINKDAEIERKKKLSKNSKLDINTKVLEDLKKKTNGEKNLKETVDAKFEQFAHRLNGVYSDKIKSGEMTKQQAEENFEKRLKAGYRKLYGYGATGEYTKVLSRLKLKHKLDLQEIKDGEEVK